MRTLCGTSVLASLIVLSAFAAPVPAALEEMAGTERAFARRAQEATVREAFIEFFADESIGFEPAPVNARESLRKRPPPPVKVALLWEPRYGDVSRSGDLGYLTGPSERIPPGKPSAFGAYFSVWKRQADGRFRVILDVGIQTDAKPAFADGFTRAAGVPQWSGHASRTENDASLTAADTAFGQALAAGAAEAYRRTLHKTGRVMRNGREPMTTRDAAVAWAARTLTQASSSPRKSETSAAGDLGYTWGPFTEQRANGETQTGYYVRVWTRTASGAWQLVAEVTT